jgi:hypothetical protein
VPSAAKARRRRNNTNAHAKKTHSVSESLSPQMPNEAVPPPALGLLPIERTLIGAVAKEAVSPEREKWGSSLRSEYEARGDVIARNVPIAA